MKNTLSAIALVGSFLCFSLSAAGQYSLNDRLIKAAEYSWATEAQSLLEKGADIEARNADGKTALIVAAEFRNFATLKFLVGKGANLDAKENNGKTALMAAIDGNTGPQYRPAIVKLLLDNGADVEARNKDGKTVLIVAACSPNWIGAEDSKPNIVKLLLEKGADVEATDKIGNTALSCANRTGPNEAVDLLEQALQQRKQLAQTQSMNPQERFAASLKLFQQHPQDNYLREKIIALAIELPETPAVPEEARQLFAAASTQIRQASTPVALGQPIALLQKTLAIAPWWANAYYNLSRALELNGQYDEAVQQLNYYLKLNPPEADAREARAHIVVIQTIKETAAQKR